jgi:hypothetical protein
MARIAVAGGPTKIRPAAWQASAKSAFSAPGGFQDRLNVEIAFTGRRRPQPDGLVGLSHVPGVPVRVRVNRHGPQAQAPGRTDDPAGDLSAVGDQEAVEHDL